jgi:hypothetical protein
MRVDALVVSALAWMTGCSLPSGFACELDAQCVQAGTAGVCQPTGFCSFPDVGCPSGQRYGSHAGDGLGEHCVPQGSVTGDETAASGVTMGDESSGSTSGGSSSSSSSSSASTSSSTSGEPGSTHGEMETTEGEPLDPDLVAWYRFEDPLDGGAEDSTDNQLHGTCASCPTQIPGVHGSAAYFDGESQAIELPASPVFELTDAFTIAAWARVDAWPLGAQTIVGRAVGDGEFNSWELIAWVSGNGQVMAHFGRLADLVDNALTLGETYSRPPTDWHHCALTWEGTEGRFYVDGTLVDQGPIMNVVYDDHIARIGADSDYGVISNFLQGAVDDVRIYRRALPPDEIAELATLP